jgi:hypothetical protein
MANKKMDKNAEIDYKEAIKKFAANPAVRYVAGGIATAILTRVAQNFSTRYPEITNVLKQNLDFLEDKFLEFKNQQDHSTTESTDFQ